MNHRSQNHSPLVYSFKYVQPKKIEPETEVNGTEGVEKEKEKEGKAKKKSRLNNGQREAKRGKNNYWCHLLHDKS